MMNASLLFGAGWENDSPEVLWREAGRAFCRLRRDDADGGRYAFIPILSDGEHPNLDSVNRLAHECELREYLDGDWALRPVELVRERGQAMLVVDYTGVSRLIALSASPWRSDDSSESQSPCPPHSVSSTDAASFTRTSSQPTFS